MKSKILSEVEKVSEARSVIVCVDDDKMVLNVLYEQLLGWFGTRYTVEKALSGEEALLIIEEHIENGDSISVVISDYIMPNMKGDELLMKVKGMDPQIKKIMLTGYSAIQGIISAINNAGLYRYITKPWDQKDMMLTLLEAIKSYEQEKKMQEISKGFESLYHKYEQNFYTAVEAVSSAIDAKDKMTAGHCKRVKQYTIYLAKKLGIDEKEYKNLECMAILHDVGKIGISDDELMKVNHAGAELSREYLIRQTEFAQEIVSHLNEADTLLRGIQYSFERFDGSGPYMLAGDLIPYEARIIAIANYFDILKMEPNKSMQTIMRELDAKKGTWFDPSYIEAFLEIIQPINGNPGK